MKTSKRDDSRARLFHIVMVSAAVLILALPLLLHAQANQFKIGVLPFVDNTGSGGGDVANAVSRAVQAEMVHSTQLQGRVLTLDSGMNPNNVDSDKAVAMGRAQNVDVVVIGTVLEANWQESSSSSRTPSIGGFSLGGNKTTMKATVTLQADLYNTTSGQKIDSIRMTGNASQTKIGADADTSLGSMSSGGSSFDNSALGKAFHSAVADLVKKINGEQSQMAHYAGGGAVSASAAAGAGAPAAMGGAASSGPGSASMAGPAAASGAVPGGQPEFKSIRIDFVPGERTVFYDDFSDMAQDEPPPHWRLREGRVDLRIAGDTRELFSQDGVELHSSDFVVPPNFTFELDFTGQGETDWAFQNKDNEDVLNLMARGEPDGNTFNGSISASCKDCGTLGSGGIDAKNSDPMHMAIWVQQGRLRMYLNGQRIVDVNQVSAAGITHISGHIAGYRPNGIRKIRIAESAPDFSAMINSTGKYVTHGIFFDTDSDRLKPESAPVLKQVADAMTKNPALKLEVDGYTDSVGDAAHNLDLSKRRAKAVQTVLSGQFGIDAGRLTSNGLGAAKPMASNDTPDGRAQNRRVEFVKQ